MFYPNIHVFLYVYPEKAKNVQLPPFEAHVGSNPLILATIDIYS